MSMSTILPSKYADVAETFIAERVKYMQMVDQDMRKVQSHPEEAAIAQRELNAREGALTAGALPPNPQRRAGYVEFCKRFGTPG